MDRYDLNGGNGRVAVDLNTDDTGRYQASPVLTFHNTIAVP